MFEFSYDEDSVLLTVVQKGYWSMEIFRAFETEYLARHIDIRKKHRNYRLLAECKEFVVQPVEVRDAFARLYERLMAENKGHCAIIVGSTLNKLQAQSAIPASNVMVFTDHGEAMDWLHDSKSLAGGEEGA